VTTAPTEAPEQRQRQLLERLHEHAQTLRTSEGWQRWLRLATRFREYSLNNQLLIAMQRPDATRVAGYKAWQALGRHVNKGERGIAILAPLTRRARDDDDEGKRVLVGFKVVRVYDISQTSGEPLPRFSLPDVAGSSITIFDRLVAAAHAEELEVRQQEQPSDWRGPRGWIVHANRTITLVDFGQGLDNMTRTLLHELAHYCDPEAASPDARNGDPMLEIVAESAAWIVGASVFGLEMIDASSTYVASWLESPALDEHLVAHAAERTLDVAKRLEALVTPVSSP
jgi:antirestriction protein ArdC